MNGSQQQLKQRSSNIVKNTPVCANILKMVLQNQCPSLKEIIPYLLVGHICFIHVSAFLQEQDN